MNHDLMDQEELEKLGFNEDAHKHAEEFNQRLESKDVRDAAEEKYRHGFVGGDATLNGSK